MFVEKENFENVVPDLKQEIVDNFEIIYHDSNTGEFNMDFDIARTNAVRENKAKPLFRLYSWKPWCVSLGFNQKIQDIDEKECKKWNFDIVRRPTGGRAVLHANELTYSVIMKVKEGKNIHDIYSDIHVLILDALSKFSPDLGFEKSLPNLKEFYEESAMSVSCFASSARYEIEYKGRKVVGSAQRLFGDTLLQHGSIIIGNEHEDLAFVSNLKSEEKKLQLLNYIRNHSTSLEEITGRKISCDEVAKAILNEINS